MNYSEHISVVLKEVSVETGCDGCIFNHDGLPCQAPVTFPLNCFPRVDGTAYIYVEKGRVYLREPSDV
jgi:hypothetical protein